MKTPAMLPAYSHSVSRPSMNGRAGSLPRNSAFKRNPRQLSQDPARVPGSILGGGKWPAMAEAVAGR